MYGVVSYLCERFGLGTASLKYSSALYETRSGSCSVLVDAKSSIAFLILAGTCALLFGQ